MPLFRYEALDHADGVVTGSAEAEDLEQLRRLLANRHLRLTKVAPQASSTESLSLDASVEIVEQIAELSSGDKPLSSGLRAAAAETSNRRVSRALLRMADQLEGGMPLDAAVGQAARGFPAFVRGLVNAAARTGRLGTSLDELILHHREQSRAWWSLAGSLTYPGIVAGLAIVLLVFLFSSIVPQFKSMFEEFGLILPNITLAILRVSDLFVLLTGGAQRWLTFSALFAAVLVIVVVRLAIGVARWHRLLGTLPVLGPLWSWAGASSFARLLAVLVDNQLPLSEALALTASGVRDRNVGEACQEYAAGVRAGSRLSLLVTHSDRLPQTIVPFIEYGEKHGDLAEGLREASDLFMARLQLRASLLQSISPPFIFVFVAISVAFCVVGLFFPIFDLITALA